MNAETAALSFRDTLLRCSLIRKTFNSSLYSKYYAKHVKSGGVDAASNFLPETSQRWQAVGDKGVREIEPKISRADGIIIRDVEAVYLQTAFASTPIASSASASKKNSPKFC